MCADNPLHPPRDLNETATLARNAAVVESKRRVDATRPMVAQTDY